MPDWEHPDGEVYARGFRDGNQAAREALNIALAALSRIASPDEMAGNGETETMTGPAAGEMRCRMRRAQEALDQIKNETYAFMGGN